MKIALLAFVVIIMTACDHPDPDPAPDPIDWPADRDCDGLLWAGEAAAAGMKVDLRAARNSNNVWFRRPVAFSDCYTNHESESAISRDMFVGLLPGLFEQRDAAAIDETLDYAQHHGGIMGDPWPKMASRVQWTGNIWALWSRAALALGVQRWLLVVNRTNLVLLPVSSDFEFHLQLVQLATFHRITGALNDRLAEDARELATRFPDDALAQGVGCLGGEPDTGERGMALLDDPNYACPTYVRGPARACEIHKAYARSVLERCANTQPTGEQL